MTEPIASESIAEPSVEADPPVAEARQTPDPDERPRQAANVVRLAIVGSCTLCDRALFAKGVWHAQQLWGRPSLIVSGGAKGADTMAADWARDEQLPLQVFPVTAEDWRRWGRSAGMRRNADIVRAATHVLAFPSRFRSGTQNSLARARRAGLPCLVFSMD